MKPEVKKLKLGFTYTLFRCPFPPVLVARWSASLFLSSFSGMRAESAGSGRASSLKQKGAGTWCKADTAHSDRGLEMLRLLRVQNGASQSSPASTAQKQRASAGWVVRGGDNCEGRRTTRREGGWNIRSILHRIHHGDYLPCFPTAPLSSSRLSSPPAQHVQVQLTGKASPRLLLVRLN